MKQKSVKEKKSFRGILLFFLLICLVMGSICFQYYGRLHATIRAESSGFLQEVAWRTGSNVDRILSDNYAVLHTLNSLFKAMDVKTFADIQSVVDDQKKYWGYQEIMFIDDKGKAYEPQGKEIHLNVSNSLGDALLADRETMSTNQMVNNRECIVFTIPLDNMELNGKILVALATVYDPVTFNEVLSMSSFGGQAYAQIVNKTGEVIIRPSAAAFVKTGYNVLSSISNAKMDSGSSVKEVTADLAAGRAGQISFMKDGVDTYMIYTPLSQEDWFLITFVPVDAVNARSDMILRITFLLCGFITLIFAGLLVFLLQSFRRHRQKLEQIAFVDEVTKGNTIQRFYQQAQAALEAPDRPQYVLIYSNIEKFKVLNEQFGRRVGDFILMAFQNEIANTLTGRECMGRLAADNFCFLLEFSSEEQLVSRVGQWQQLGERYIKKNNAIWGIPAVELGAYVIENDSISFHQMIDRAKLSLKANPRTISSKTRLAIYDDEVRRRLFREKQLEDWMESSMQNGEFKVYLQPKYSAQSEQIQGAEALCRWMKEEEGMIYPDEFIPLFEKNGFILQLDLWVFGEVCRMLRRWLDEGKKPLKVSVNCSRMHLQDLQFIQEYRKLARQYDIPAGLLEIEFTESIVLQDAKYLTQVIDEIHEAGFTCSMDDFGSGYSSLNLLQDISVDTLKLDKIFFHSAAKDPSRMESVVENIVRMAKALSMETVAEGVESRQHVEMLRRMGCDLIQGYVFAKPVSIADFEKLAFHHSLGGPQSE